MKVLVAAVLLLTLACGRSSEQAKRVMWSPSPGASSLPISPGPSAVAKTSNPRSKGRITGAASTTPSRAIRLTKVADLKAPLAMKDYEGVLYFAEKGGRVRALRGDDLDTVLDISTLVSTGSEQGLLGLEINEGILYVDYTDRAGDTRIREYRLLDGRADPSSARELLSVDQPFANHNGGNLVFGPDGFLYIGLGDGGSGGDPQDNGQSLATLLGKILRIDPRASDNSAYRIPPDNPFVGRSGARGEIWSYGLRNPWRFSFDRTTRDMYIGDVGQSEIEEIDFQPAARGGDNYGWARFEGSQSFKGPPPQGDVKPIYEYDRKNGNCSVTGGYIYRGQKVPGLIGTYIFADFCGGKLRGFTPDGGRAKNHDFLGPQTDNISSFGQDNSGELYVLSLSGPVFRIDPMA